MEEFVEVQGLFNRYFAAGGVVAAEKFVAELTAEAEIADGLAQTIDALESENLTFSMPIENLIWLDEAADIVELTVADHERAKRHLAFALQLLEEAKNQL